MNAEEINLLKKDFSEISSFENANDFLLRQGNIQKYFFNQKQYTEFLNYLQNFHMQEEKSNLEWGDVQTPPEFTEKVYAIVSSSGFKPDIVVEPTCGKGNFLISALETFPGIKQIYGIEIQEKHLWYLILTLLSRVKKSNQIKINLILDDIFTHSFTMELKNDSIKNILVIGNPPWVTASELSRMNAKNIPVKSNIKNFSGIEALTGKSNFDISENIIVKMIENFSNQNGKLAFLCKTSVIRNIMKYLPNRKWKISNIQAIQFDAKKVFGKSCEASLLLLDLNSEEQSSICSLSSIDEPFKTIRKFGWVNDKFVADIEKYQKIKRYDQNTGNFTWRQGVKHDATKIVELELLTQGNYKNKLDEELSIEDSLVYPLLKGSDIRNFEPQDKMKRILLTQKSLNEDTQKIKELQPRTWRYLISKKEFFDKRKSCIYFNKHDFSIFGIGDYAFSMYKVAVAGFYKKPFFAVLKPIESKPVIVDDTCYYLSFDTYEEALFIASALNSKLSQEFFESIVFQDAKRPFTKEVLMRLDIKQIMNELTFTELENTWNLLDFENTNKINSSDFENYKKKNR